MRTVIPLLELQCGDLCGLLPQRNRCGKCGLKRSKNSLLNLYWGHSENEATFTQENPLSHVHGAWAKSGEEVGFDNEHDRAWPSAYALNLIIFMHNSSQWQNDFLNYTGKRTMNGSIVVSVVMYLYSVLDVKGENKWIFPLISEI